MKKHVVRGGLGLPARRSLGGPSPPLPSSLHRLSSLPFPFLPSHFPSLPRSGPTNPTRGLWGALWAPPAGPGHILSLENALSDIEYKVSILSFIVYETTLHLLMFNSNSHVSLQFLNLSMALWRKWWTQPHDELLTHENWVRVSSSSSLCVVPLPAAGASTATRRPTGLLMVHAALILAANVWLCGMTRV